MQSEISELIGGLALDNKKERKVSAKQLQGWRKPENDEMCVIQGILIDIAKGEVNTNKLGNIGAFFLVIVSVVGALKIFESISNVIVGSGLFIAVVCLLTGIGLLFVAYYFAKMIYWDITNKPVKTYLNAVKSGSFHIIDVEIIEKIKTQNVNGNLDGHFVKVKDSYGNKCNEILRIRFVNEYYGKDAILVDVISEKVSKKVSRLIVLPKKHASISTWEKGLKLYQKYMK